MKVGNSSSRLVDSKNTRCCVWTTYFIIFGCLILLSIRYTLNGDSQTISSEEFWKQSRTRPYYNHTTSHHHLMAGQEHGSVFPKMVHQTWKSKSVPPHQTLRWRKACEELNPQYDFKMFDDDDLMTFTLKYYPKYGTVLQALKGVYMADMARVILAYHFGGIYMDLDFYCHRPMLCLENYAVQMLTGHFPHYNLTRQLIMQHKVNILLVPREPLIHAVYLHGRPRVIIQDLYMATPKHPFLRWLLDDLTVEFVQNNYTLTRKGPLSYSIDPLLDEYYREHNFTTIPSRPGSEHHSLAYEEEGCTQLFQDAQSADPNLPINAAGRNHHGRGRCQMIIEVGEHILHPLLDASNHRLHDGCSREHLNDKLTEMQRSFLRDHCNRLSGGKYLAATLHETVLVHMWTHSFLDWSFLRGWYDQGTYVNVERSLPATKDCPASWSG